MGKWLLARARKVEDELVTSDGASKISKCSKGDGNMARGHRIEAILKGLLLAKPGAV